MELDIKPNIEKRLHLHAGKKASINLYRNPPFGQLTLEECEDLFRQRLEALHIFEKSTGMNDVGLSEISNSLSDIKSHVFKTNCIKWRVLDKEQQKQDHFSHMLTRMYCIHNHHLWEWFKTHERKLLYYRLKKDLTPSSDDLEAILIDFNFDFTRVRSDELVQLKREEIIGWNCRDRDHEEIFKVNFINALKFVARRSVALKEGFAFLTRGEIISIVCDVYERHLDSELSYARQHFNVAHQQTQQLLESLDMVYKDFAERIEDDRKKMRRNAEGENQNPYKIDINDIEQTSKLHFPPCVRYLQESLVEDHHLRHAGRLIYGTFLRSGGVDMDSALEFWRREFTKKIPNDKFERDYKYNIRHLYGKEGHKKALSCFSCDKIINDSPGPLDKHGCPFKHFNENNLTTMLTKHGLSALDIESIMKHVSEKNYKQACYDYYTSSRGSQPTEPSIRNPIHFYYESKRLANRPKDEIKEESLEQIEQAQSGYADEEMTDDL